MLQMNNLLALKANIRRTEEAEHRRRNDLRRAFNTKVLKRRSKRGRNVFPKPSKTGYTVYGAEWCPWCRKAKDLLTKKEFLSVFTTLKQSLSTIAKSENW